MITAKKELLDVPISDLIPYERNPRKNDKAVKKVAASLERFGLVKNSVVVDEDMVLITGHTTLKAMQSLGWTACPAVTQVYGLTEEEKRAYRIADNKLGELAEWDLDLLAGELASLDEVGFDVELTGFDTDALAELVPPEKLEVTEDDYEPPVEIETSIQRGDLFRLGRHRLLCGDATSAEDVGRLMDGKKADLLLTDPPYGVSYASKNEFLNTIGKGNRIQTAIENDHKKPEEMSAFWVATFTTVREHMRPGASYYVTCGPMGDLLLLFLLALKEGGFPLRHMLIWAKNNHVLGRSDYHYKHEPIIYGWVEGAHTFYGGHSETTLWTIDKPHKSDLHPTMKPVALFAKAVENSTKSGETVLDPFLGSGTTLVACEQLGRTCYGMEISPQYCQVIIDRWEKLTGQKAEKVDA
ncbi:MAG: DNA modification methylase [Candidatus Methanoculleus thermohydrogenotrophicum]|nr:DNA modification methylase [Candidatus Methanoculleus thermohydrogenotrophicum]